MIETPMQLLTIVGEAILEDWIIEDIRRLGARGYTITDARGSGTHGTRRGNWKAGGNIRVEVVGPEPLCRSIADHLAREYEQDYGLLMFTSPVTLRN